jgi:ABC-type Fe3+/spermidine/putrescine transport system ATPase subunit
MKLVSQDYYVLDNHTIEENVYDKLKGFTEENKRKRTTTILRLLELTRLRNTLAANLSSGQKQRVAIARALAILPGVLLLDEPFSNLDKLLRDKLFAFISKEVKRHRTSVILVTHTSEEALKYADSVAILDDGKIVQCGPAWKVYYQPRSLRLAGLLGPYNIINCKELETGSAHPGRKKIFTRPDKIKASAEEEADLRLTIIKTAFNGKCYEILGETAGGATVLVYSAIPPEEKKTGYYRIET